MNGDIGYCPIPPRRGAVNDRLPEILIPMFQHRQEMISGSPADIVRDHCDSYKIVDTQDINESLSCLLFRELKGHIHAM